MHDRTGSDLSAMAMNGKRSVKSFPARVISRTPAASLRARMRKPSCLISCSQPGPEGGAFAGDGRHGSMMPKPGRVRSRKDMGGLIGMKGERVESVYSATMGFNRRKMEDQRRDWPRIPRAAHKATEHR